MDPSAVANTIKELETVLSSLGGWLEIWTAVVVIGLIVEYAEPVRELVGKRPFDWKILRTLVGGLLITVGVAGELCVQFKAARVESALRSANHTVQAELNNKAQEALAKASKTHLNAPDWKRRSLRGG